MLDNKDQGDCGGTIVLVMYKAETTIELGNTRQQAAAPAPSYLQAAVQTQTKQRAEVTNIAGSTVDNNIPPPLLLVQSVSAPNNKTVTD
ncbi:hypothetical protein J6590_083699 [Homalodisca vitripennis]|nr:hypothetical protein J6590_083699 [Homalodisca vitripennis]